MKGMLMFFYVALVAAHWATAQQGFDELQNIKQQMAALARQVMLQQFYSEQRVRTEGSSGLKLTRVRNSGLQNYHSETHTGQAVAAVHDHANYVRTVGMGEFAAVLNGVEFRTRHNDYRLSMPHRTSKAYGATEEIPFPDVPPSVLKKETVEDQINEMREYFKAWRDQDNKHRDYENYFKSVLCYLEGAWTTSGKSVDESFLSERHFIDARTWQELQEKVMFAEMSGGKSRLENLAFLPTAIMGFLNDSIPLYAQWNYRILCHPTQKLLPTSRLRVVEDLSSRMMGDRSMYRHLLSRAARFQINTMDSNVFQEKPMGRNFLDELMEEIPGKDNYAANLTDDGIESETLNVDGTRKNAGYYHRWFRLGANDAMGVSSVHRGFSDNHLFVAATTQDKVAGMSLRKCQNERKPETCSKLHQKWSYAIPLELIYLTPLLSWNPHNIPHHGDHNKKNDIKVMVNREGRNGDCKGGPDKALLGTNSMYFYQTPAAFFVGGSVGGSSADTASGLGLCVLDSTNTSRHVYASGTRVLLPNIAGVGVLRQRYPIMPIHAEGSSVWKELNALRNIVMEPGEYKIMFWNKTALVSESIKLMTGISRQSKVTPHSHEVFLTSHEIAQLKGGQTLVKETSEIEGHIHTLHLTWSASTGKFVYTKCDNVLLCWDRHDKIMATENSYF